MGWDSVIITTAKPQEVFRGVVNSLLVRWPGALVFFDGSIGCLPAATLEERHFSLTKIDVVLLRDHAMDEHMDDHAYAPMEDGDGPLGFLASIQRDVEFHFDRLEEVQVADKQPFPKCNPYPGWICAPALTQVSVVTHGDPEKDAFCRWANEMVRHVCSGLGRGNS